MSRLVFQTTALNHTDPKFASTAAITSGTDSVLKISQASMICWRSVRWKMIVTITATPATTSVIRFHDV